MKISYKIEANKILVTVPFVLKDTFKLKFKAKWNSLEKVWEIANTDNNIKNLDIFINLCNDNVEDEYQSLELFTTKEVEELEKELKSLSKSLARKTELLAAITDVEVNLVKTEESLQDKIKNLLDIEAINKALEMCAVGMTKRSKSDKEAYVTSERRKLFKEAALILAKHNIYSKELVEAKECNVNREDKCFFTTWRRDWLDNLRVNAEYAEAILNRFSN